MLADQDGTLPGARNQARTEAYREAQDASDAAPPAPSVDPEARWPAMSQMGRGVAARLLISVMLFSSAVTLVFTVAQLYLDYRYDVDLIERRLRDIADGYPGIIGESLWALDRTHLQIELEGILKLPDMDAVEVRETGAIDPLVVKVGQRHTQGSVLVREVPINRIVEGVPRQIGTLYIEATLNDVYQRLWQTGLIILVSQGAKTFVVSFFIMFIFYRLVTRHLTTIAGFMRGYDFHRPSAPLRLRRRARSSADELDQVVVSFNDLCGSLQSTFLELQKANAELERDIAARIVNEKALRETEQRYRHLFHYVPVALLQMRGDFGIYDDLHATGVTDLNAHLLRHPELLRRVTGSIIVEEVNDRAVELFHARDASQLIGPATPFWTESPSALRRALESRFRGELRFEEEMKVRTLDGRTVDVLCTISRLQPISDKSPTLFGLIDITERVRAREKLQQLEADFAHAARISMLGELTASIAHEINQPLVAVATSSEATLRWLNRPEPDIDEVRALAKLIRGDAQRAADIIARVRAMAVRRAPQRALISIDEVIRESLLFLRHEIQADNVAVLHNANPAAPKVMADRTQLQQVIVNLVVNALQAVSQSGTVNRKITIGVSLPVPGKLRCTIEDSGPGIKPQNLSRLFQSFFTTKDGGMGMGLSISQSIIEAHGGQIGVDNESINGGARFFFTLPVASGS